MKCRFCAADSFVLSTRKYRDVLIKRTRECFNEHQFVTYEVHPGNLDRRTLDATQRGASAKTTAQKRKAYVLRHPDKDTLTIAVALGITDARVRQIRAASKTGSLT